MSTKRLFFVLIFTVILLSACQPKAADQANLPNPASVFCEENGGKLEIRTAEDGSQSGVCVFEDGSECDEWAFQRGECQPGDQTAGGMPPLNGGPSPEGNLAEDGHLIYHNSEAGYSIHYPADAEIVQNDDPTHSITIQGPDLNGDRWPMITITAPADREEYRLPEEADLLQWLIDHSLTAETRAEDAQIGGSLAIHFRHNRSEQSYAFDRYYFAHDGQLYELVIGHTADKEDWELYNHLLASFQFDS